MSEQILSSWQDGLDSRRSNLTTSPHALEVATNVHINQGAEIEKRRAFVDFGLTVATEFGLEVTSNGLVNFGSAVVGALPTGVSYVRLQHPSDNTIAMTAIVCSCSFAGKSWAVARFANNDVFIYYDGSVIPACTNGLVLTGAATNQGVATQFYNFLNTSYFTSLGFQVAAPVLNGTSYYVDVYSTPGVSFALVAAIVSSAAGTLGTLLISTQSQGTAFSQANFGFAVYMGNTGSLFSVKVSTDAGATFGVSLLGTPIPWATNDKTGYATALNIASTISSSVTALPIIGNANNNQVTLLADSSLGATPNGYPVQIVSTGDFCLDDMVLDMTAVAVGALTSTSLLVGSLATVFNAQTYNGGGTYVQSTPAGTYFWHKGANDVSMAVSGGSTYYADNFFTIVGTVNITFTGIASAPVTAQLTLMVEILGSVTTGTTAALLVTAMATKIRAYCTANGLNYTACASQMNTKQLVVSRNFITSTLQFYPILATDIVGAAGIVSPIVTTKPILKGSYIIFTNTSGIINISVVGGAAPYLVSFTSTQSIANGTDQYNFNLPEGNPSALTGSFQISLAITNRGLGSHTMQFTLSLQDSTSNVTTLNISVVSTGTAAAPVISSVTFL